MKAIKLFLLSVMIILLTGNLFSQTPIQPSGSGNSPDDPYLISTLNHLAWMSENSAAWWRGPTEKRFFKQIADIDASATSNWNSGAGFRPIGYQSTVNGQSGIHFVGEYDGQHYTISNLFINRIGADDKVGLFNEVAGISENTRSAIKNLRLENVNLRSSSGSGTYTSYAGGIAGRVRNAVISNCSTTGTISAYSRYRDTFAGGIAGDARNNTLIEFSHSSANVTVSGTAMSGPANYYLRAGGLVGQSTGNTIIRDSYSRGNVRAESDNIYFNENEYAGGIVGAIENNDSRIERCYTTGRITVSHSDRKGGIAGRVGSGNPIIQGNLWDTNTTTVDKIIGNGSTNQNRDNAGLGTNTMKLDSTYINRGNTKWDLDKIWGRADNINNGYPVLRVPGVTSPTPSNGQTNIALNEALKWEPNTDVTGAEITGYRVRIGTTNPQTTPWTHAWTDRGNNATWSPGTLQINTLYYWQVQPYNANGIGVTATFSFRTVAVPNPVTNLSPNNNRTDLIFNNLQISWQNSTTGGTPTSYDIYYWENETGTVPRPNNPNIANHPTTFYTIPTLKPNTWYSWCVIPKNTAGAPSSGISIWRFKTREIPPGGDDGSGRVREIYPTDSDRVVPLSPITLQWTPPDGGGTPQGYRVRITRNDAPTEISDIVYTTEWTPNITLLHNTWYNWEITPFNSGGDGLTVCFEFKTVNMEAEAVYPDNGHPSVPLSATLSWKPTADSGVPEGYRIRISANGLPTGNFFEAGNDLNGTPKTEWDPHNALVLQLDTVYFWEVVPYYSTGNGKSSIFSFKTAIQDLPAPTNVRTTIVPGNAFGTNNVLVEWEKPVSGWPDGYFVFRNGVPLHTLSLTPTTRSYTDDTVSAGTAYRYEVAAFYAYTFETSSSIENSTSHMSGQSNTTSHSHTVWAKFEPTVKIGVIEVSAFSAGYQYTYGTDETKYFESTYGVNVGEGLAYIHGPFYIHSNPVPIFMPHNPPNPPRNLRTLSPSAPGYTASSITLEWDAPVQGAGSVSQFIIYRDGVEINRTGQNTRQYTDYTDRVSGSGLIAGNVYVYHVTALYTGTEVPESIPTYPLIDARPVGGTRPSNWDSIYAGTEEEPYLISSLENLRWLSEWNRIRANDPSPGQIYGHGGGWWMNTNSTVYFKQTADIDASATATWYRGRGFRPIGHNLSPSDNRFTAVYDGQGYKIENLYIDYSESGLFPAGLFSSIQNSTIKNLHLVNVTVIGNAIAGGIVGEMSNSIIENSSVTGTISSLGSAGGIVGKAGNNSLIQTSFTSGIVSGNVAGGIAGTLNSSEIRNCYSSSNIAGAYTGGIVGTGILPTIEYCYSVGDATDWGNGYEGGIAGYVLASNYTSNSISYNFWNRETAQQNDAFGHVFGSTNTNVSRTTAQMKQEAYFIEWDFEETWAIDPGMNNGYPYLINIAFSDAEAVAAAKAALTWDAIRNANTSQIAVVSNLSLPESGVADTLISWASSNTFFIYNNGAVTRPINGSGDAAVTLSATITRGNVKDTVVFNLIVKEMPQSNDSVTDFYSQVAEYEFSSTDKTITIDQDMTLTSVIYIPGNADSAILTITSADPEHPVTLTRGFSGEMFSVFEGATLVLENIIIDGNKDAYPVEIYVISPLVHIGNGGTFIMNGNMVLMNNDGGYGGGGVFVGGGEFIMNGGKIIDNIAKYGGGVYIAENAFTVVDDGYSGGFTMTGGEITGNTAINGGGVYVGGGVFNLGGKAAIRYNTNDNVYLEDSRYITIGTGFSGNGATPPVRGMEVWVAKTGDDGVIVESGANENHTQYFFADESGSKVAYEGGQLRITIRGENDPVISVGNVTATKGSLVSVPIAIRNNPGFTSMRLEVTYDSRWFTLESVTDEGILGPNENSEEYASPYTLSWPNDYLNYNITVNGTIAWLNFRVANDAPPGRYAVSQFYDNSLYDIMDSKLNPVYFDLEHGAINVPAFIYGDVNRDGRVNPMDSTILGRWIANWPGYEIDELAADVDGDGRVTPRDRTVLRRHLANWPGYETLPWSPQQASSTLVMPFMAAASPFMLNSLVSVPSINVSSATGSVGDIVEVNIGLSENPGIITMRLGVKYDESALRLVEVIDNGKLGEKYHLNEYASPHTLLWENGVSQSNIYNSGDMVTLRFEILSESAGTPITVSYDGVNWDIFDVDLNTVYFEVNNGFVSTLPANEITLVGAVPTASVKVLNGNKNDLTIIVTETYSDGSINKITATISINNNAAGSYQVGSYVVYVDTKGNDQIRQCYIVK